MRHTDPERPFLVVGTAFILFLSAASGYMRCGQGDAMTFWAIVLVMTLGVGLLMARALRTDAPAAAPAASHDLQVYRDQLATVDRDVARGVVPEDEAERLRTEIARRILHADREMREGSGVAAISGAAWPSVAVIAILLGGAALLYREIGAPGYPDLPIAARIAQADALRAGRPTQAEAEALAAKTRPARPAPDAEIAGLMDKLRDITAKRPNDLEGHRLLARNEAGLGNFSAAAAAQAQVIQLLADKGGPDDYAALADLRVLAAGGLVTAEAEEALAETLRRDPANGTARYYLGLMHAQTGRPDITFRLWRALLEEGPENAPWIPVIRRDIVALAQAAGVDYAPPSAPGTAALPGPSAGDVAAAADMSAEDRQQMIRTMVEGLNDRLAAQGGTPEEWARLIGALGVLSETDRARAIWSEAQAKFADQPEALATIRAAAAQVGVTE
jgi:cytochrome c-type biogenesis protein CcmH